MVLEKKFFLFCMLCQYLSKRKGNYKNYCSWYIENYLLDNVYELIVVFSYIFVFYVSKIQSLRV